MPISKAKRNYPVTLPIDKIDDKIIKGTAEKMGIDAEEIENVFRFKWKLLYEGTSTASVIRDSGLCVLAVKEGKRFNTVQDLLIEKSKIELTLDRKKAELKHNRKLFLEKKLREIEKKIEYYNTKG